MTTLEDDAAAATLLGLELEMTRLELLDSTELDAGTEVTKGVDETTTLDVDGIG